MPIDLKKKPAPPAAGKPAAPAPKVAPRPATPAPVAHDIEDEDDDSLLGDDDESDAIEVPEEADFSDEADEDETEEFFGNQKEESDDDLLDTSHVEEAPQHSPEAATEVDDIPAEAPAWAVDLFRRVKALEAGKSAKKAAGGGRRGPRKTEGAKPGLVKVAQKILEKHPIPVKVAEIIKDVAKDCNTIQEVFEHVAKHKVTLPMVNSFCVADGLSWDGVTIHKS